MALSTNEFLAILNTRRYTEEEWTELSTRLKKEDTDTLQMLYFIAADKDYATNTKAREEGRPLEVSRRWEYLLYRIRDAYDHAKLRENKGPWILSAVHHLDCAYQHYKKTRNLFNP